MRLRDTGGQAAIEAIAIVPMCLVCALAVVETGVIIRDKIAVTRAAGAGAAAVVAGTDPRAAVLPVVPGSLRDSVEVTVDGSSVTVTARSRVPLLDAAGPVEVSADAIHDPGGAA